MEAKKLSKFFNRSEDFSFFDQLPEPTRLALEAAIKAWDQLHTMGGAPTASDLCKFLLGNTGLSVDESVFSRIPKNCEFEIWDSSHKLIGSSNGFYSLTSFTLVELFNNERSKLFKRDPKYDEQLYNAINVSLTGKIQENPVEPHIVSEMKINPVQVEVSIRLLAPVRNVENQIVGVVAFLDLRKI